MHKPSWVGNGKGSTFTLKPVAKYRPFAPHLSVGPYLPSVLFDLGCAYARGMEGAILTSKEAQISSRCICFETLCIARAYARLPPDLGYIYA